MVNNVCAYITDLKSTNGTKLNGRKLDKGETVEIFSNDKIRFGKGKFIPKMIFNRSSSWRVHLHWKQKDGKWKTSLAVLEIQPDCSKSDENWGESIFKLIPYKL